METDTKTKLSASTIALHWIVAIVMIALLSTGIFMAETETLALYPWHKSFGVLIVLFVVLRIAWRMKNGWPAPVRDYSTLEKKLSKIVHWLLLIGTVIMPISGFIMSSMGGYGVHLFGLELFAANPDPANPQEVIPINKALAGVAHAIHGWAGYVIVAGVVLHIAGAVKHHLIDKDGTLRRMLGSSV